MQEEVVMICLKFVAVLFPVLVAAGLAYWFNFQILTRQTVHNKKVRQQGIFLDHISKTEENIIKYWEHDASDCKLGQSVIQNIEFLYKLISIHGEKFVCTDTKPKLEILIINLHRVATGETFQSANKASPDIISKSLSITGEIRIFLFD